ncbi:LamG-like jellyroll fold domain-containing protein [Flammeovirga agarivorans]|uniref:Laminin G domain-containing protein n=1 Tax=Flammeovirga agarivorans TaxID=2726742 RepID=A0A7X8SK67_9BACT|nr:LamG-like jellyroll fold domain-containing protein [Flammeovirga agarivorans]NLR91749.1 hypothetical protein [Flammeovirga agarivorans]
MKRNTLTLIFTALLLSINTFAQETTPKWRFINIPDYHNAEGFTRIWNKSKDPAFKNAREERIASQMTSFREMKNAHGGELVILPGDTNGGHWYKAKYLNAFKSYPAYADYTEKDVIIESSRLCYQGLKDIVYGVGYQEFLVAVGDHELGDNPWRKNSKVVKNLPHFREGFAKVFTLDEKGNSRFTKKIGKADARPIGTKYEHTSNAIQYKNILFVTIDMFRFDGADINLGDEGTVEGDITGEHLKWFEAVLSEAQKEKSIKHIIVQSHLPIIYPVRKYASSGMLVSRHAEEKVLNLLRKYHVDLYLAGEVHMNTVTKDDKSDLIQFVGRGNDLSNLTAVDVEDNKLSLVAYHKNGDQLGTLTIDKSNTNTTVASSGLLAPISPQKIQIHWSFDKKIPANKFKFSVTGNYPNQAKDKVHFKGITSPVAYLNDGDFEYDYSLLGASSKIEKGIIDNAIRIDENSKLFVLPIGPIAKGYERTISLWLKTNADGRRIIFNSNSYWGKGQFYNISINEGQLELALKSDIYTVTTNQKINDGKWHHVAVVVPQYGATLNDNLLYVDGKLISERNTKGGNSKVNTSQANWMSIATQMKKHKSNLRETMNMQNFKGLLDDVSMWTRALNHEEIQQIYQSGLEGVSALELDKKLAQ